MSLVSNSGAKLFSKKSEANTETVAGFWRTSPRISYSLPRKLHSRYFAPSGNVRKRSFNPVDDFVVCLFKT